SSAQASPGCGRRSAAPFLAILALGGELLPQPLVLVLEVEDAPDAGHVHALFAQAAGPTQTLDVVVAVPAGAAFAAERREQPLLLEQAQGGLGHVDELRGDGDAVERGPR